MELFFVSGALNNSRYKIDREITIGRDVSNDIVIPDSAVSLVHCRIHFHNGCTLITDLGSTNGIHLNGQRIISSELHDGDGLSIGRNRIRVEVPGKARKKEAALATKPPAFVTIVEKGESEPRGTAIGMPEIKELSGNIFGTVTYFLKRKIADGGMGAVYEAEQFGAEGFIKKVAIKTILPAYVQKASFVSSFIGEAKLVANLVHQNIVQIHHLGRHDNGYYIAMEYIDGVNLMDFMSYHAALNRQVPVEIATFIASRICRGLEYAHSKKDEKGDSLGLVHRDVSPNNVMITHEGEVKLTDFGVARAAHFMEDDEEYLVGSVEYMSPEQADCTPVDGRSDLFSLGLIYYELLTGIRVFQCKGDNTDETVELVKEAIIPDPCKYRPDLPAGVAKILMKCLKKKPEERYQSAGELSYTLEHEMYSKGYGPTIVTLAKYLEELRCDQATSS